MKKSIIVASAFLALVFALSLSYCGKKKGGDEPAAADIEETAQVLPDKSVKVKKVLDEMINAWETGNKNKFSQAFTEEYKVKRWCNNAPGCKGSKEAKKYFNKIKRKAAKKQKKIDRLNELKNSLQEAPLENDVVTAKFQDGTVWKLKKGAQDDLKIDDRVAPPAPEAQAAPAEGQAPQ